MEKFHTNMLRFLPVLAITAVLLMLSQWTNALPQQNPGMGAVAQQQSAYPQQEGQKPEGEAKTFTGKIVKSGDKLVLSAPADRATYQLDDQEKAQEFVNKNVKVTGVLDASNRLIH